MTRSLLALSFFVLPAAANAQAPCTTIALTKSSVNASAPFHFLGPEGGIASVWVSASTPDCTWVAQTSVPWITFLDGTSGSGSRWLRFTVAAATTAQPRSGSIDVIANQVRSITINQSGSPGEGPGLMQSPAGWTASPSTAVVAQPFRVSGYAIDPRATSGPGVTGVDIYYRPSDDTTGGLFLLGPATYGRAHPHVADRLGSEFLNSGFDFEVSSLPSSAFAPGRSVSIEAYAHSSVDGTTLAAGATRVNVMAPTMTRSVETLQFGAALSPSVTIVAITPGQPVTLAGFGWNSTWLATPTEPWITLSATSGTGPGTFVVSINTLLVPKGGQQLGLVRVSVPDVPGSQIDISVRVDFYSSMATAAPFGAFDPPPSPSMGAIPLGGWALDDIGVTGVAIYRNRTASEGGSGLVFIGNATFVDGARPDVAGLFPFTPQKTRAGWGYMLLSNVLPDAGTGTFTFHAFAVDAEGKQTLLGSRDIVIANNAADAPFGALDAPAPGETISGTYTMGGWALSATPSQIRAVFVYLDGQNIGQALYGQARPDVAALFGGPNGPLDAPAAGFRFTIDTRGLANGLHTIAVLAGSNNGDVAGLGSRFFTVRNP